MTVTRGWWHLDLLLRMREMVMKWLISFNIDGEMGFLNNKLLLITSFCILFPPFSVRHIGSAPII